jgi:hypothetical protein
VRLKDWFQSSKVVLILGLSVMALALGVWGLRLHADWPGLLLNLASEIVGIVVTVALIDWFNEQRSKRAEVQRLAWDILHRIDYTLWLWGGGSHEFSFEEMGSIIRSIRDDTPIHEKTSARLRYLGWRASELRGLRRELVTGNPNLESSLVTLGKLVVLTSQDSVHPALAIRECLACAR